VTNGFIAELRKEVAHPLLDMDNWGLVTERAKKAKAKARKDTKRKKLSTEEVGQTTIDDYLN
jgi:hypothetical protein